MLYWKELNLYNEENDERKKWKSTDKIAAIEFYDEDGFEIAAVKSEKTIEEEQSSEVERKIPKGHELIGLRCCPSTEGIKNLSFMLWSLPKESMSHAD